MRKFIYNLKKRKENQDLILSRQRKNLSTEQLKSLRDHKFKQLIKHLKFKSPYYEELLLCYEVNKIEDLAKFPVLTKQLLKANSDSIKSSSTKDEKYLKKNSTSGSTGEATYFFSDIRDGREGRAVRGDEFVPGFNFLDRQLIFWGAERDVLSKKDLRYFFNRFIVQKRIISTYHLTDTDITKNIAIINKFKPTTIVGYPSALHFMAMEIEKQGLILKHYPKGIISAGESLQPRQREFIEKIFQSPVYNRYGCREFGHIANECSAHEGFHYNADDLIIEILNDDDEPSPTGEIGNIVITDLNNFAFPMIRYKIGDLGALSNNTICSCGCTLPKLETIEGRSFDVIHGLNGNKVSGTFWTLLFRYKFKGVESFQIRQNENYELTINLKADPYLNKQEQGLLQQLIKQKLGEEMSIDIKEVHYFEYTTSGKFKWISSALN